MFSHDAYADRDRSWWAVNKSDKGNTGEQVKLGGAKLIFKQSGAINGVIGFRAKKKESYWAMNV